MAKTAVVTARVDPELKEEVEAVLSELGLSTSQAILMYFKQIARQQAIPFPLQLAPQTDIAAAQQGTNLLLGLAGTARSGYTSTADDAKALVAQAILEKHTLTKE